MAADRDDYDPADDAPPTDCPKCGWPLIAAATGPLTYSGKCDVYLLCEDGCDFEYGPVGTDGVL